MTNNNLIKNDVKIVIPLEHLSNFWKNLNIPLINCVLIDKLTRDANYDADSIVYKIYNPENATFKITDAKLYVPIANLSKENDIKFLEKLKSRFKRTIKWNKYRSQLSVQSNNSNLNYLIDPTFTNVN